MGGGGRIAWVMILAALAGCDRRGEAGAPPAPSPTTSAVASAPRAAASTSTPTTTVVGAASGSAPEESVSASARAPSPDGDSGADAELPASDDERRVFLAARRARGIVEFEGYAAAGVFPHNHDTGGERIPYLLDRHGRLCAVAYLMVSSTVGDGFSHEVFATLNDRALDRSFDPEPQSDEALAIKERYRPMSTLLQELARLDNHVRVADVNDGPLLRWILTSGFTQAECALIQPSYTYLQCDDCKPGSEQRPESLGVPTAAARELEAADRERIRGHLTRVVSGLRAHTVESLALCLERLREVDADRF